MYRTVKIANDVKGAHIYTNENKARETAALLTKQWAPRTAQNIGFAVEPFNDDWVLEAIICGVRFGFLAS